MKGNRENPNHISATMPGTVIKVVVKEGDEVRKGDSMAITEAMKMETTVQAPFNGKVKKYMLTMEMQFKQVTYLLN